MKPGYKQTEVGVIPEEWEVKPLGEIGGVRMCKRVLKHQTREHGDVPFYKIGTFGGVPDAFIAQSLFDEFKRKYSFPQEGDVLISAAGTIGRTVIYDGAPAYFQDSNIVWIDNDESKATNAYLWHRYQVTKWSVSHGGTVARLYNDSLRTKILIPIPPLPEQRAIATALSDVDGLLGGLDRLIAKKRDLKQAAMQQLLTGQTRLPGFQGEWEVKTLFDLAARKKELFDDGDWIESEHITTEGIRLIQTGNIGVGSFVEKDDKKYINEDSFASLRCKQLKQGDLLVCRLADPAGRACVLGDIGEERIVTSVDVTIFRPPSELVDRLFLSQVFSTSDWFRAVSDRSGGTTHKRISRGALGRLSINLPYLPEQTAIASVLTEMDGELAVLEQRREKTRALKQAMMQELLTGRTRLV
jgi:type I restriction enzyme S subunit